MENSEEIDSEKTPPNGKRVLKSNQEIYLRTDPKSIRRIRKKSATITRAQSKATLKDTECVCHKKSTRELEKKETYHDLLALQYVELVANLEKIECPICLLDVDAGQGVTLQDCLHSFCKECLASSIQYTETALVNCPYRDGEYCCESHLLEKEVKALVTTEVYEKYLKRSVALAESQAKNSFHCKTPDCAGWCLFEEEVNAFSCPVCGVTNCITCAAIHTGKNCRQYQDDVAFQNSTNKNVKKTRAYFEKMLAKGQAMRCPNCQIILMKRDGCDWFRCTMCRTEICWVTRGPRWGPCGRGDISGGCRCRVNGKRCHPNCHDCH